MQSGITNATFDGLAFPVARVRIRSGAWYASIYRDIDRTFRARMSYVYATGGGARGALPTALKCLEKFLADANSATKAADYVAVPGNFSADAYTFTFVPSYILNRAE